MTHHADPTRPVLTRRTVLQAAALALGSCATAPQEDAATLWHEAFRRYRCYTGPDTAAARTLATQALSLDATSARAHALLAATYCQDATFGWNAAPQVSRWRALQHAGQAFRLARWAPPPRATLPRAWVLLYHPGGPPFQTALAVVAALLADTPTAARVETLWAHTLGYLVDWPEAQRSLERAETASSAPGPGLYGSEQASVWLLQVLDTDADYGGAQQALRRALAAPAVPRATPGALAAALPHADQDGAGWTDRQPPGALADALHTVDPDSTAWTDRQGTGAR